MKLTQQEAVEWMRTVVSVEETLSNCENQVFKLDIGALILSRDRFPIVGGKISYELLDETEYADALRDHSQFGVGA